ncbi:binding-protein-dependent transport systems inner membrane component [Beutenbergia cavernae DSM 12333]|uniref:Binding-protein-dependent transport systems inner membrane component n=1 Tax=Beutenbergia cavernae (strain ATCC BAA-8 / DSM 12333 / CCUG 43141 / JCM 11478 / NBRC 16432 / NCIMB 13614 / HKI 0122) TaxID=471853 RepID=C5C386_BEUC1|nr:sugar ABC transporter permease [Beutenbergia cavernae]ACQ79785.1 binding-protein-dependent transport systems inner membrane component [Beutenbergia cavernae DSM 12333]
MTAVVDPPRPGQAAVAAPSRPVTRNRRRSNRREALLFGALILPNLAAILVFSYYPTIYNVVLSFMDWDMVAAAPEWIGLANYQDLFTSDDFYTVLGNTAIFTGVAVVGSLAGGLAIGQLLSQRLKFSGFTRTMAFAPHMLPGAAVGILWLFMFDPTYGLSRWFFGLFGLTSPSWTTTSDWSIWAITIAYTWQRLGFVAIIYYTAIQDLPRDVYEAAELDGARGFGLFWSITRPLLSPVTFFLTVTGIISAAQAFDIIATLTGGGPGNSSATLTWMVYEEAFQRFDVGTSAAAATVLFLVLLGVTIVQTRTAGRQVHYS